MVVITVFYHKKRKEAYLSFLSGDSQNKAVTAEILFAASAPYERACGLDLCEMPEDGL